MGCEKRGLGLLALPAGSTPHLTAYERYAAVAIEAVLPDGTRHATTATVEEITRGAIPERGLLLDLGMEAGLPVGSEIWLVPQPLSDLNR